MATQPNWKKWVRRVWSLGYSRLFMALGVLFCLIALALPVWSVTVHGDVGEWDTTSWGWVGVTTDSYLRGAYDGSVYQPYSAPSFQFPALASAIGTSYVMIVVLIIVLVFVAALYSTPMATRLPHLALLVVAIFVLAMAIAALLYPIATVPSAAAANLRTTAFSSGFWGSSAAPPAAWGAGAGWWLLLIAAFLGGAGAAIPFLRYVRQPVPPPPREWQVER